ncbi:MAG TPA: DUF6785 family protein [Armatimonadota bacterium]|jgi:hypothetical protein
MAMPWSSATELRASAGLPPAARITVRAVALGLFMAAVVVGVVVWAEQVTGAIMIGFLQIPPVAVALLLIVVLLNRLAAAVFPRARLQPAEYVVIYVMMVLAAMVTSRGLTEDLYPTLAGLNYLATPANHWQQLFFGSVKPYLVPWNPARDAAQLTTKFYYEGLPPGVPLPWGAWLGPSAVWLALYGLVYTAYLGMAAIIYRLWADDEHLSFPLTRLPLDLVTQQPGTADFLRNPLMWAGFLLPLGYFSLYGLHNIWPAIPKIAISYRVTLTQAPWSSMGYTELWFSLAGVGLFYLLSSEMVFSLWFFFLLARLQEVGGAALGIAPGGSHGDAMAFVSDQTAGISFALVGMMVWGGWIRVRDVWRKQAAGDPEAGNTLLQFRGAVWLIGLALVGIVLWWRAAGGTAAVALNEFGIYLFVQSVIMARATSEAGTPMTEGSFTPFDIWGFFSRKSGVGKVNLTLLSFTNAMFSRDLRGITLTGMLDAQKLADGVRLPRRKLVPIVVGVLVFAILLAGWLHLTVTYQRGGVTMYSYLYTGNNQQFWHEHAPLMEGVDTVQPARPAWFGVGVVFCLLLGLMRRLYVWWPLHPLGAALSVTWVMCVFWFPALVAWLIKGAVTRYGGLKTYMQLRPFFLGLIFGEFFAAVLWSVISFAFHTKAPMFPWP